MSDKKKLSVAQVRNLFSEYDALEDVKARRSAILQQVFEGYGPGPYIQEGVKFQIRKRKINNSDPEEFRYLLHVMQEKEDTVTEL